MEKTFFKPQIAIHTSSPSLIDIRNVRFLAVNVYNNAKRVNEMSHTTKQNTKVLPKSYLLQDIHC